MARAPELCSVDGCERHGYSLGFCGGHHRRLKEFGDPLAGKPLNRYPISRPSPRRPPSFCAISGCDKLVLARKMCKLHYSRWRNAGDPLHVPYSKRARRFPPPTQARTCSICQKPFQPETAQHRRCRVCIPDRPSAMRYERYRLTGPDYNALLAAQGGTCGLCDKPPRAVDHDHETGAVRGLLCLTCNRDLSRVEFGDWIERATTYLGRSNGSTHKDLSRRGC